MTEPTNVGESASLGRGWFCMDCRRLFRTVIRISDGSRWHNRVCGTPLIRAEVVA